MAKRAIKFYFKNEKELMKELGLKPTPGSGNGIVKEDGQNDYIIAQLKSTDAASVTIKQTDVNTLFYNAIITHKIPIFINQFLDGQTLISMRLEDIPEVANYIICGKAECREECLVSDDEPKRITSVIKSTKRTQVKDKIQKEREESYTRK